MSNGATETAGVELRMDRITFGQIRKLRKLQSADPGAAEEYANELLDLAVPGLDDLPVLDALDAIRRFNLVMQEGMQGKDQPPAPSLPASGAGESATTAI